MQFKEGMGWKACYNDEKGIYGAEVVFQGSWDMYEITAAVFNSLTKNISSKEAEELICTGRHLYMHVNDRCGPPYTVVFDDDYCEYCPWAGGSSNRKVWSKEMTDAAVELFESEKKNRNRKKNQ